MELLDLCSLAHLKYSDNPLSQVEVVQDIGTPPDLSKYALSRLASKIDESNPSINGANLKLDSMDCATGTLCPAAIPSGKLYLSINN